MTHDEPLTLLGWFLRDEATPYVCGLLRKALSAKPLLRQEFNFNLFDVTIEPDEGAVYVDDICDASERGRQRLSTAEFTSALDSATARDSSR